MRPALHWLAALAVLVGTTPVFAQNVRRVADASPEASIAQDGPAAMDAAELEHLVADLDSPDLSTRERAQDVATNGLRITLREIVDQLRREDLTPEQRQRLSSAGFGRFQAAPRGAMGVSFSGLQARSGGVGVASTVAGFDSRRVLKPGDILGSIAGERIANSYDARRMILSFDPGEEISLEVTRAGEVFQLSLRLGSFKDLGNNAAIDDPTLQDAWITRVRRMFAGSPVVPLGPGLPAERYRVARALAEDGMEAPAREEWRQVQMRVTSSVPDRPASLLNVAIGGEGRRVSTDAADDFGLGSEEVDPVRDTMRNLARQVSQWKAAIHRNERMLRIPTLDAGRRAQITRDNARMQQMVREREAEIRALLAQRREKPDDR